MVTAHALSGGLGVRRALVVGALLEASDVLRVEPGALSMAAYRGYCREHASCGLPTVVEVIGCFGGWERAREALALSRSLIGAVVVEPENPTSTKGSALVRKARRRRPVGNSAGPLVSRISGVQ